MEDTPVPASKPTRAVSKASDKRWREPFLAALAATSNVTASARAADITTTRAYDARRKDPQFYRAWQEALCEGYEHLEMALLQRLRAGEIKPATGAKKSVRVFDNATALRLLIVHRESVSKQQATRTNEDAGEIIAQINARIEKLRRPASLQDQQQNSAMTEGADVE